MTMSTIWNVHTGVETLTDKPRAADQAELDFYLCWLARSRGIVIPAGSHTSPMGIIHDNVVILEMPGYGASDVVTCEILDDAGEVVRTMPLPVSAKGTLPMNAKQVKGWTGLETVKKPRKARAAAPVIAAAPVEDTTDYEAEAMLLGWSEGADGMWRHAQFKYAKVSRARHAVEDHADWLKSEGEAISAPVSADPAPAATLAPETDVVALLAARVAALEAVAANRAPVAIPAPANDDTVRPVRSERERAAIVRAWRMRCEMRERADLDRRALLAANDAYHGALEVIASAEREVTSLALALDDARTALKAEQTDRDALCEERNAARAHAATLDRDNTALRAQLRDATRRADRLVMIATGKRRAAATAEAACARAVADLRGAEAERRAVAARFAKLEAALDASPAAAAVVSRKLHTLAA
jgi:hypothetical protein